MIVVSNTTPLNYLVLIDAVEVLPALFERIHVPEAVLLELGHSRAPALVREWAARLPGWVQAHSLTTQPDAALAELHAGEREAIMLAADLGADLILLDELAARSEAGRRGLPVAGTLGILDRAAERDLVDFREAIRRIRQTSFHVSEALLRAFLEKHHPL